MTFDAEFPARPAGSVLFGLLAVSLLLSVLAISLSALVLWRWRRHEATIAAVAEEACARRSKRRASCCTSSKRTADRSMTRWLHGRPTRCARILETELPDAQVILVSNREPYIHNLARTATSTW